MYVHLISAWSYVWCRHKHSFAGATTDAAPVSIQGRPRPGGSSQLPSPFSRLLEILRNKSFPEIIPPQYPEASTAVSQVPGDKCLKGGLVQSYMIFVGSFSRLLQLSKWVPPKVLKTPEFQLPLYQGWGSWQSGCPQRGECWWGNF